MIVDLRHGDCLDVLKTLDADSIDACVTDPPYGLSFMGKDWDHGVPGEHFWREVLRVLKPGAHLLAFGGTRTFHRLTCAIEDAGFEVRDCLMWLYGSGFPKSLNVSKAMDKAVGAENVVGHIPDRWTGKGNSLNFATDRPQAECKVTAPATDLARQWTGWGTSLKPAWEPIILARKPLIGTVAANVAEYGTGAVNVDGCRIGTDDNLNGGAYAENGTHRHDGWGMQRGEAGKYVQPPGRWPANLILDDEAAAALDRQSGTGKDGTAVRSRSGGKTFASQTAKPPMADMGYGGEGGASRFFYTAKASRAERNAGLEGMEAVNPYDRNSVSRTLEGRGSKSTARQNHHPTVKPLSLMRYLVCLVTPPDGTVLDPFMGSGSTGCGAVLEGFNFIGIEMDEEYIEIARRRIGYHNNQEIQKELF